VSLELAHRLEGPGDAPLLVLSPSLGTTLRLWEPQLEAVSERFRVLRHDHPGHGDSPVPGAAFSVEEEARALLRLLDGLGVERFSFCGLSLGGMVGMWLAVLEPARVETLTLCCTGAKLGSQDDWLARAALVREQGPGVLVPLQRERWFTAAFRDSDIARGYLDELGAIPPEGYALCCEAVGAFDFRRALERIETPTLILAGAEDPVTPPEVLELLSTGIARSTTEVVPGAAHLANVEQPEIVGAAVLRHAWERTAA